MTHRDRILAALRGLPKFGRKLRSLPRTVLVGMARTPDERRAADALVDYMVKARELKPHGGPRNRTYSVGQAA